MSDLLRRKAAAFDWLERTANATDRVGNGIAIFPGTKGPNQVAFVSVDEMGDEDGSNLGDSIMSGPTLLDAVESAMRAEGMRPDETTIIADPVHGRGPHTQGGKGGGAA